MELDIGIRTGKTTRLIQWMKTAPEGIDRIYISGTGNDLARQLWKSVEREDSGLERTQFIGIEQAQHLPKDAEIAIDEVVLGMERLLRHSISRATIGTYIGDRLWP